MKLTVMMAAYNTASYVEDAVASLLRQRREGLYVQVLVVNDGSTDGTEQILRRLASEGGGVILVETPNQGVTRARNEALRVLGSCDYVSFLDSDDLSPQGHFASALALFVADPTLELAYYGCRMFDRTGDDRFAPAADAKVVDVRGVHLGSGIYSRSLLARVGMFDESFDCAEDLDFLLRMFELGPKYVVSNDVGLYYRRHGGNMTLDAPKLRRGFSRAILKSVQRRRSGPTAELPKGLFDTEHVRDVLEW